MAIGRLIRNAQRHEKLRGEEAAEQRADRGDASRWWRPRRRTRWRGPCRGRCVFSSESEAGIIIAPPMPWSEAADDEHLAGLREGGDQAASTRKTHAPRTNIRRRPTTSPALPIVMSSEAKTSE